MTFTFKHTKYTRYFSYITSSVINNLPALLFATFQRNFGIIIVMLAHLIAINFGTAIFALLALAGDAGCFVGPEAVLVVSEYFPISGSCMKAGIVASVMFAVLIIICLKLFSKDMKNPR